MSCDGWKTISHELLVGYLANFYPELASSEIALIDQLRQMHNDISLSWHHDQARIPPAKPKNNPAVIGKLKQILTKRINKTR